MSTQKDEVKQENKGWDQIKQLNGQDDDIPDWVPELMGF